MANAMNWQGPPLILASASPRRSELLSRANLPFEVITRPCVESESPDLSARELAQWNAHRKAAAVAGLHPGRLVLGADTVVSLDGVSLGKPRDLADAEAMLRRLQGRTHHVVTGVCLLQQSPPRTRLFFEQTRVTFHPLSRAQIRRYLGLIQPLDKAGAYALQDHGDLIVREIHGSYSNVVGLPMERVEGELRRWQAQNG